MKKNLYLLIGTVAAAMMLTTACSHDNDIYQPSKSEIMSNAENRLGVKIDSTFNWNMTANASAVITVNGNYDELFTVKIYSNDPLVDGKGYVLKQGKVGSGGTFKTTFEYPKAMTRLIVSVTDLKGFTSYKSVVIEEGLLETTFGGDGTAGARTTRSSSAPGVPDITIPTSEYARSFLADAKEPTDANVADNRDNSYIQYGSPAVWWSWIGDASTLQYNKDNFTGSEEDEALFEKYCRPYFNIKNCWDGSLTWADYFGCTDEASATTYLYNVLNEAGKWTSWVNGTAPSDLVIVADETYVKKFKITGTWDKSIRVLATEQAYGDARTVYISGKWTLANLTDENGNETNEQRVGGGAVIVIDEGGELEIPEGKKMTFVNQARLVVMPGGKISGDGAIEVTNGNAEGLEGYNGGTIEVGKFNNNMGKFHNYGKLYAGIYAAGAGESNFYNHGVAHILSTYDTNEQGEPYQVSANARIFNACQWFCENDMRAYIVENTMGSYFHVGGQLEMSQGNDGTNDPSYVALAKGALVRLGSLSNNLTDWTGPTDGTAVLEIGQVDYLNWDFDNTPKHGYFINNIAITLENKENHCDGKNIDIERYRENGGMTAYQKMNELLINGTGGGRNYMGNNGTAFVETNGANIFIPADDGFAEGVQGCTPGYNGQGRNIYDEASVWTYAFEDTPLGDYDMNDVVIKVKEDLLDDSKIYVTLCCSGASFDLHVHLGNYTIFGGIEVHRLLGRNSGELVNTGIGADVTTLETVRIDKPSGFSFANADFWIDSPAVKDGVHLAKPGEDPHGVAIPGDWKWPREAVNITEAYPLFTDFIRYNRDGESVSEEALKWYEAPVEEKVYTIQEQ